MKLAKTLSTQAPMVFVVLSLFFLWMTGSLHFGAAPESATEAVAADPHAGHGHGPEADAHEDEPEAPDPHAGHDHGAEADAHEDEPDPHAGHDHGSEGDAHTEDEADPHAGHGHDAEGDAHAEDEADPHAGHDHAAAATVEGCGNPDHDHTGDWCAEHRVPESACTRCNPALVAKFKKRGDWCGEHGLPESQCGICNPGPALPEQGATGDLDRLERFSCEHGVRTVECDDCRFEIGVVKLDPGLVSALLGTGKVELREGAKILRLTGQVALARTRVVDVHATAAGRVVEVKVDLGEPVGKGDLLAVVHSGEYGEAKASYLQAYTNCEVAEKEHERQANVAKALDELIRSLAEHDRPSEGERPRSRQHLPTGIVGERKSKLIGAAAALRLARLTYERERALEEKGISARAEHEAARHELEAAEAEYASLLEEVKLSLNLEKIRADNAYRQACTAVLASEQRLRVLGLDERGLASLRKSEQNAEFARLEVRAPRKGTVISLDLALGRYVEAGASLLTIADLGKLWVWCDLYERDLAVVAGAVGNGRTVPAHVRVTSFPKEEFEGVLDLLGSEIDEHTRTIKARIQVDNPDGRLRPGMFADVSVVTPSVGRVRMVPRTAVLTDEGESFLFQHWKGDYWVRRDVVVRDGWDDFVVIEGDVPAGATVAVSGAFMLKSDVLREKMGAG